ncbi:MAG TPA: glycoside hydrolase family 38 C-terminal domain-containing protein [Streptosporangiaceae bacterium]|nr:glycoside hydrolase family 38 C-terminal domain-containing protein [Streptosporangiaceae bacterium]
MTENSSRELHVIANAHMDPVWIWDWREGYGEVWATFSSALDRLGEHQDLVFTASSAAHHAWIEEQDPAMFERIGAAVAAGRWYLAGGMWIEPDCNLPSGESMCRQLLAGQRYFQRAFGRTATVGYNVDSFGHNAGLPQLLAKAGLASYVFMRPGEHERDLPAQLFTWRDASGAALPAYRIPFDYATMDPADIPKLFADGAALAVAQGTPLMLFVGVGNHGGGPTKATLAEVDQVRAADPAVRYSDPGAYFAQAPGSRPEVTGELQHHAPGCYSVSAWVKAANDHAETALLDAEGTDLIAARLGARPSRQPELSRAWTELLLCQFHDILAGTASSRAYPTIAARFGHVETVADQVSTSALYQLAHLIDTGLHSGPIVERHWSFWTGDEGRGVPFLVFNPLAWPVRQPVIATRPADQVLDSEGRQVEHQPVASGEVTLFSSHTLFVAELAPLGYEVFWLQGGDRKASTRPARRAAVIESDLLRAEVDEASGTVVSLCETSSGLELLDEGGIRLELRRDTSDTWSHGLVRYEEEVIPGQFDGFELVEDGPVRWTLRLRFSFGGSTVLQDLSLVKGMPFAQVRLRANWSMPRAVLKLVLPWRLGPGARTVAGAAYGFAERDPAGAEEPVLDWLDCYSVAEDRGIGLTTGHLHGYDATEGGTPPASGPTAGPDTTAGPETGCSGVTVRVTVLRNPLAADHGGAWGAGAGEDFATTDAGWHDAVIGIHPHQGDWRSAGLVARAAELARPPAVVADTYHSGSLPPEGGFLTVAPADRPVVRAIKRAEADDGVVLRLVEPAGEPLAVTLGGKLLGREVRATLAPFEVATLFVPDDPTAPARSLTIAELALALAD